MIFSDLCQKRTNTRGKSWDTFFQIFSPNLQFYVCIIPKNIQTKFTICNFTFNCVNILRVFGNNFLQLEQNTEWGRLNVTNYILLKRDNNWPQSISVTCNNVYMQLTTSIGV